MNVVILDGYSVTKEDLSWDALLNDKGFNVEVYPRTGASDTVARCLEADAVLTNKVVMSAEVIDALPRLRYIGVLATGYNVVDCEAASRRGIVVTNIPAYSTDSVAQLVFAHVLNVTNSVAHYAAERQRWPLSEDFTWSDTPLTELAGKTMCIYGLGNIGKRVAEIALAFGMRVVAVRRRKSPAHSPLPTGELSPLPTGEGSGVGLGPGLEVVPWSDALRQADIITLHCPLTDETRAMINATTLGAMKRGAILVNTGRGPLVDEQAVAEALRTGQLGAYCTDVLSTEPPAQDNPLLTAPRCFITPHIAWATREARQRLIGIATANLLAFAEGRPVNVVGGY